MEAPPSALPWSSDLAKIEEEFEKKNGNVVALVKGDEVVDLVTKDEVDVLTTRNQASGSGQWHPREKCFI
ncbi:inosine-5'-monophosphate dehydrogenase [Trifolium pratense]|uniref:Inosine-5'-monophosphate dehydrogenase n=1 Tax=Trifolium pratense TaxID=57577 RepID=A0A2K3L128_TRIPR|nr:inosine-5'-monophosphate dehydrogenase [Trifolium pratense]